MRTKYSMGSTVVWVGDGKIRSGAIIGIVSKVGVLSPHAGRDTLYEIDIQHASITLPESKLKSSAWALQLIRKWYGENTEYERGLSHATSVRIPIPESELDNV